MTCTLPRADLEVKDLAEIIFTSTLSTDTEPSPEEVEKAVTDSYHRHHDSITECAGDMAAQYYEDQERGSDRMKWALALAAKILKSSVATG